MEALKAGSYEVRELTATVGMPIALPEGSRVLMATYTTDGAGIRLLVLVPEAKALNEAAPRQKGGK